MAQGSIEPARALAHAVFGIETDAGTELAEVFIERLEALGHAVYKKKAFKNGRRPNSSAPMTPGLAHRIRAHFKANPTITQQDLARIYNVNSGRVAEALSE